MKLTLSFFSLLALVSLSSCASKEESYSGIADERGIVTNNTRTVTKEEKKKKREALLDTSGIIPEW